MTWPRLLLFCVLASLALVRTVSAQPAVEVGGGMRLPAGWLINGDILLPHGLFVGADIMFIPGGSDSFSAYSLQGGLRSRSTPAQPLQAYVVGSYGINRNSTGTFHVFGAGAGVRYWFKSRFAPFIEYRHVIAEVNSVGRAPHLSNYGSSPTVAFGGTVRLFGSPVSP